MLKYFFQQLSESLPLSLFEIKTRKGNIITEKWFHQCHLSVTYFPICEFKNFDS